MENNKENDVTFSYSYSAKQQEEIRKIRAKYVEKKPKKMDQLRKLDARVEEKATAASIAIGIIGVALLGIGLSMVLAHVGNYFTLGIIIGTLGIAGIAAAYPVHTFIAKKERKKITPLILKLTDELLGEEKDK